MTNEMPACTFYNWSVTMYTGLSLVICIVWLHCFEGTINCVHVKLCSFLKTAKDIIEIHKRKSRKFYLKTEIGGSMSHFKDFYIQFWATQYFTNIFIQNPYKKGGMDIFLIF